MNKKIITFGEIMMRLTPPSYQRIIQANKFNIIYGGGEANVAVSLANYGLDVSFVTKLPDNPMGQAAFNELRKFGVKTNYIVSGGKRLGIYFCEKGASQRPSNVIYDRSHSSISEAESDDFDWDEIFSGVDWFHFTGITPALSENMAHITKEAVKVAKGKNIKVSCDLNYRAKLWSQDRANEVMTNLMDYVDIVIANEEDAEKVFGIKSGSDITSGELDIEGYKNVAQQLIDRYDLELVGSHLRESHSASNNGWIVVLYNSVDFVKSTKYNIHIVDRVGGGDSFAAGLIYSQLKDKSLQDSAEFSAAASCLKQSIPGDFNHVDINEVETLAKGNASGRVKR